MQRLILFVMSGFALAGFAAMLAASMVDGRKPVPASAESEPPMLFPDAGRLRLAVSSRRAVLGGVALMLPLIYLIQVLQIDSPWMVIPVFASIPLMGVFFALTAVIRCPRCGFRLLVQRRQARYGEPSKHRSAWGELLRRVSKREDFRCMSCGQRFTS